MKYYSTNKKAPSVGLRDAVLKGLAPDGGLYMPETIPRLDDFFLRRINLATLSEIAFAVGECFFKGDIQKGDLEEIVAKSMTFDAPLIKLSDECFSLELFHGPTLSFKDFGMSFMARLIAFLIRGDGQELHVLAATSGDTGSAVGHGFLKVPGVHVWILYPKGQVSHMQEQQLTTMCHNVTAVEVEGTFDDCQALVKQAFKDPELNAKRRLTSANSINIGRLIPQIFYYFFGYVQLHRPGEKAVFSVPSGNFGNLTAGLMAKRMGLPVKKIVGATNVNDTVPQYLKTGLFSPHSSIKTLSNAMDVGNPSNFARIVDLYGNDVKAIKQDIYGCRYTDAETIEALQEIYKKYSYIADPHGAIGYLGLRAYQKEHPTSVGILLETAHPGKFPEVVEAALKRKIDIPLSLQEVLQKKKVATTISNDFDALRQLFISS